EYEADQAERRGHAQESRPLALCIEREPSRDPASKPDYEPRRQLRTLGFEEPFQPLVKRGKPRLPIAPSTLWKRRFPYVRGARPLHCSKREEECAPQRKREKFEQRKRSFNRRHPLRALAHRIPAYRRRPHSPL